MISFWGGGGTKEIADRPRGHGEGEGTGGGCAPSHAKRGSNINRFKRSRSLKVRQH